MSKAKSDCKRVARVSWSGRSQAVRLPGACRFEMSEAEAIREEDRVTLRSRGKDWGAYFDAKSCGTLPERRQPPLDGGERAARSGR